MYYNKYIKYKQKYLELLNKKTFIGGSQARLEEINKLKMLDTNINQFIYKIIDFFILNREVTNYNLICTIFKYIAQDKYIFANYISDELANESIPENLERIISKYSNPIQSGGSSRLKNVIYNLRVGQDQPEGRIFIHGLIKLFISSKYDLDVQDEICKILSLITTMNLTKFEDIKKLALFNIVKHIQIPDLLELEEIKKHLALLHTGISELYDQIQIGDGYTINDLREAFLLKFKSSPNP